MTLMDTAQALNTRLAQLTFAPPVTHVYNPADYAWDTFQKYLESFGQNGPKDYVFVGMNPGPWGMVQTGVPFGDPQWVEDFLKIDGVVGKPLEEHSKRPVTGLKSPRREVSGERVWKFVQAHFGTPQAFSEQFFIWNYCPLCFLEQSGRNRTPDKLPIKERKALFAACDEALVRCLDIVSAKKAIGIGRFAANCLKRVKPQIGSVEIGQILHPSPASPPANRGWQAAALKQLELMEVPIPPALMAKKDS